MSRLDCAGEGASRDAVRGELVVDVVVEREEARRVVHRPRVASVWDSGGTVCHQAGGLPRTPTD